MKSVIYPLWAAAAITSCQAGAAQLNLSTPTPTVLASAPIVVRLDVSGLNAGTAPGLGAFDIDVVFDASVLGLQSVAFGTGLDVFGLGDIQAATLGTGTVNLFEVALDTPADLLANQGSAFTLATLTFSALANGTSPLIINLNALADASGGTLAATAMGTSIQVGSVPEPQTLWLMLCGLGVLGWTFLRRQAQPEPPVNA